MGKAAEHRHRRVGCKLIWSRCCNGRAWRGFLTAFGSAFVKRVSLSTGHAYMRSFVWAWCDRALAHIPLDARRGRVEGFLRLIG